MRVIKFRAKCSGHWRYGDYVHTGANPSFPFNRDFTDHILYVDNTGIHFIPITDINTIGQFTGLYDAHGKRIYEGDILKWKADNRLYAVIFNWGMFYASVEVCNQEIYGGFPLHALAGDERGIEIVGNIYDNPELKKKGYDRKLRNKIQQAGS